MEFLSLFMVALFPVMKVLLVTLVGLFLALDRINVLGSAARTILNHMLFYVFSPAMVAAYLADTVTWDSMVEMWFMPINILLTFILGSLLGWILLKITKAPPHQHGLIIGCCSAGNLGNLLLIMIPAICDESDSPFGDSSTCTSDGDSYASLSMAIGAVYIWSYVYTIIKVYSNRTRGQEAIVINDSFNNIARTTNIMPETIIGNNTDPLLSLEDQEEPEISSTRIDSQVDEFKAQVSLFETLKGGIKTLAKSINLKMIFTPSIIAAIIGFTIGVVSPLRKLMIGDNAPLRTLYGASDLIGGAAIPSMTLIVGANLLNGLKSSEVSTLVIIGIVAVRYVALPRVGIGVVKAAYHFGWVGSDSLYQFVLMLQFALPPAMSVGTITQLLELGQSDCSVIMLWSYVVAALFLTLWSTVFMSIVS